MHPIRRLIALVEAKHAAVPDYDLEAKYDQFNTAYFNGELPKIPVTFADLKSVGGDVRCAVIRNGPPPDPRMVRLGYVDKYHNCTIKPGSHKLRISSLFKRDNTAIDGILMHEMIHVYFNSIGKLGEQHGQAFLTMRRKLSQLSGIDIPLRDDVKGLELANPIATKAVGVILLAKTDGTYSFALISAKMAHEKSEELKKMWERRASFKSLTLYTVATPEWTVIASKYPVGRTLNAGLYRMTDKEALDNLLQHGHKIVEALPAWVAPARV